MTNDDEKKLIQERIAARRALNAAKKNGATPTHAELSEAQESLERQAVNGNEQHDAPAEHKEEAHTEPNAPRTPPGGDTYPYDRPFRLRMIAACTDADWFESIGHVVAKPEYYNTKEEQTLVKFIHQYYATYNHTPGMDEIAAEFAKADVNTTDLVVDVADTLETSDLTYAKDTAIKFATVQSRWLALDQGITQFQHGGDSSKILQALEAAENIGANLNEWRSPADVDNYDFDDLKWLVDGILKQGKVNLFYGQSGCGKSWLLLDMCKHLVLGEKFLEKQCEKSTVLWIDEENREDEMMERLYSFRAAMTARERTEFDANFKFRTLSETCKERFNLNDAQAVRRLIKQIQKETSRPVVVVMDSMGAVSYSNEDIISENKQAIKIMNLLADIVIATKATLIAIHHPTKDKSNMFGGVFMTNLVDLNVEIAREKGDEYKDRHVLKLTSPKDRKGVFGDKGLLAQFCVDGRDDHYRAINPRFELEESALSDNTKNRLQMIADKVEDAAITYIKWHPECLLNKSKDKAREDEVGNGSLIGVGRDAWRKAVDKLLEQEMYDWSDQNPKNTNRTLVKGARYEELRQDLAS